MTKHDIVRDAEAVRVWVIGNRAELAGRGYLSSLTEQCGLAWSVLLSTMIWVITVVKMSWTGHINGSVSQSFVKNLLFCSDQNKVTVKALANEDILLLMMFLVCTNALDTKWMLCFHAAQTGKHLLRAQNVFEQNQKHFLCPGNKICVRNKCCGHGQTGKHLCRQQCVRNNASSFASTFRQGTTVFTLPGLVLV